MVLSSISNVFYDASIFTWDIFLTLGNLVMSSRPVGQVIPAGHPGYGGYWPEYRSSQEGDSRSCCPCLNAMANHGMSALTTTIALPGSSRIAFCSWSGLGIIPRSGRGIKFSEVPKHIHATYNFSPSFCYYACHYAARILNKCFSRDTFDLEEISLHNAMEHDASFTRE